MNAVGAIEFDPELRRIDLLDDIAYLPMDLQTKGRRDLAFRFISACLVANGDYKRLPVSRDAMVCRAPLRARVTAVGDKQGLHSSALCGAQDCLALAWVLSRSADALVRAGCTAVIAGPRTRRQLRRRAFQRGAAADLRAAARDEFHACRIHG